MSLLVARSRPVAEMLVGAGILLAGVVVGYAMALAATERHGCRHSAP